MSINCKTKKKLLKNFTIRESPFHNDEDERTKLDREPSFTIVCRTFIYTFINLISNRFRCVRGGSHFIKITGKKKRWLSRDIHVTIILLVTNDLRSTIYLLSSKFPKSSLFFFFSPRPYRPYRSYQYRFFPTFLYNKETACHGRVCSVGLPTSGKLVGLSLAICWDRYMYCFIFKKRRKWRPAFLRPRLYQ